MKHLLSVDFVQAYVKMPCGKSLTLQPETTDCIKNIKTMIEIKEGISTDQQRLVFGGKQLVDNHTILDCDVMNGSILHLEREQLIYCVVQNSIHHQVMYLRL